MLYSIIVLNKITTRVSKTDNFSKLFQSEDKALLAMLKLEALCLQY